MIPLLLCLKQSHDPLLVGVAILICVLGVYASYAISGHARRSSGRARSRWGAITVVATGGTAWATHFVLLLAFRPGVPAGFDPALTAVSLIVAMVVIGSGTIIAAYARSLPQRFLGGAVVGAGVAMLHYLGQLGYRVEGVVRWDPWLVSGSVLVSLVIAGLSTCASGMRRRWRRRFGPPLLLLSIYALHFSGMAAARIYYDPRIGLPADAIAPSVLAPVAALAAMAAVVLAAVGLRFDLQALRRQKSNRDRLRELASVALEGLVICDHQVILTVNRSLERLCGREQAELKGRELATILRGPPLADMVEDAEYDAEMIGAETSFPVRVLRRTVTAGARAQTVVAVRDQRERLQAEAERETLLESLRGSLQRAEAANVAKSEFLANMSHEIRTPLNGVLGMTQVLAAGELTALQRERVQLIAQSGQSLLTLLNDVLDLAKIEAGHMELQLAAFDLEELVRGACNTFADVAAKKGLSLEVEIEGGALGSWRGDGPRLRQVLHNLISNAVKFTSAGGVRVSASCGADAALVLEVRDTGIGIASGELQQLFSKFHQVDSANTRRFGGTGLGLAISRELVDLMGGCIAVESVEGRGSVFRVRAMLERLGSAATADAAGVQLLVSASGAQEAAQANDQDQPGELRVLAAEDNAANQLVLQAMLHAFGVRPKIVGNGALAVEAWEGASYDLIFMDIQMPELDGMAAARRIRALEAEAGRAPTPIIALTANVMSHQIEAYFAAGMDGCIAKPIQLGELAAALNGLGTSTAAEGVDQAAA